MAKFFDPKKLPLVSDIRALRQSSDNPSSILKKRNPFSRKDLINAKFEPEAASKNREKSFRKNLTISIIAFVAIGGVMIFSSLSNFRKEVMNSLESDIDQFRSQTLNFDLLNNSSSLTGVASNDRLDVDDPIKEFGIKFWPVLKNSFGTYKSFKDLSGQVGLLLNKVDSLSNNLLPWFFNQKGNLLIKELEDTNQIIKSILTKSSDLSSTASRLKDFSVLDLDFYLPLQTELSQYQKFLEALITWLKLPGDRHLFVMMLNPSEIRPGGGFLGSYVDLSLSNGSLKSLNVHDINDIDRELDLKVVPPKPIQTIASRWKTADANWFFDFPSSAKQVIQFAENSNLYKKDHITFDGVIAISADLVKDLLSLTGPVKLDELNLTIESNNFLSEIQKEIQTKREAQDSYPKKILKDLVPVLAQKLQALDANKKQQLLQLLGNWFEKKDIIFFSSNPEIQQFLQNLNLSGAVFELPQNFIGDYLAVINSNLGGGKTDLFIDQKVYFSSQVNEDGTTSNHLNIERSHHGQEGKYSWYKVPNQNYLEVFTLEGARLDNFSGGIVKKIKNPLDYKKASYIVNPLVSEIESSRRDFLNYPEVESFNAFGKGVFAAWTKTEVGKKSEIVFDYANHLPSSLSEGKIYQFIFEKQPGSKGEYKFEISAPIGFIWKENNLPIFEYNSSDPPGRLIINLTLKKAS